MSDAKTHFTVVLTVHETTTTPGALATSRDSYGRPVREDRGEPRKSSTEVLKLQLRGDTLADATAKAGAALGALEVAL